MNVYGSSDNKSNELLNMMAQEFGLPLITSNARILAAHRSRMTSLLILRRCSLALPDCNICLTSVSRQFEK